MTELSIYQAAQAATFERLLVEALRLACNGQVVLVIVPAAYPKYQVLNWLVRNTPAELSHTVRMPGHELHFDGTRGSVRVYSADHIEYNRRSKRMLGYLPGIPTFLHPELEEA